MKTHRVRMPRMGTSVHESTVVQWLKKEGDMLAKGEPLLRAESEKVDFEVESPCSGKLLQILVPEERKIPVGAGLALIETEEEVPEEVEEEKAPAAEEALPARAPSPPEEEWIAPVAPAPERVPTRAAPAEERAEAPARFLSPRVRRLAKERGLSEAELAQLKGIGQGGRVRAEDVEAYLAMRAREAARPAAVSAPAAFVPSTVPLATDGQRERKVPLGRMRKRIAENLTRSVQTIPQANVHIEVDMTRLVEWREAHKEDFRDRHGFRLTYMPFFCMAVVGALRDPRFERFNASLEGGELIVKRYVNLGVAVAVPDGLLVPVVPNAETLSFSGLAQAIDDLASRARAGKLSPEEVGGGTFTITNAGATGMLFGIPIINPPEAAILALGTIERRVKVLEGDAIALRHLMVLSLTFDHRINDGMAAGLFARSIRDALERVDLNSLVY